jgi:hypothetical protein
VERDWWSDEAARQGLVLTEADLAFIRDLVTRVKAGLADCRWPDLEDLEPPYRFEPPAAPRGRRRRSG